MGVHEARCIDRRDIVRPATVRTAAKPSYEALLGHPEEDAPIQRLVPLGRRHPLEALFEGTLAQRDLVSDDGRPVDGVLDLDALPSPLALEVAAQVCIDLEQVEEGAGAQEAIATDARPVPASAMW